MVETKFETKTRIWLDDDIALSRSHALSTKLEEFSDVSLTTALNL